MSASATDMASETLSDASTAAPRERSPRRRFACDWEGCGYSTDKRYHLQTHQYTHTGDKPHACDWEGCSFRCAIPSNLRRHKLTHTGEKPYACNAEGCSFRGAQQIELQRHKLTHTGEKPHACDWEDCSFRCALPCHLQAHKRTHTGEKPHACDFEGCSYRCAQAGDLRRHKRTHTGEKPYACNAENCEYRCGDPSALWSHKRAIHSKRGRQRQKRREQQVAKALTNAGITYDRELTVNFCGEGNKKFARVDFVIYRSWGTVLLEVDEHQHAHYGISCDAARMLDVFAEQMKLGRAGKFHFVRFNPDEFKEGGQKRKVLLRDRLAKLIEVLDKEPPKQYSVTYLYYDRSDCAVPDVCFDDEYPGSLRAIVNL